MADVLVHTGYANYGDTRYPIKVYVTYSSTQSGGAENYSRISCGMKIVTNSNLNIGPWVKTGDSYVGRSNLTFDGSIPNFSGTYNFNNMSKSFDVTHNEDGTGKTTIYWKWGVNSAWGQCQNPSGSFEITLPKINRYFSSTPTLTLQSKTETSLVYNWSTTEECSAISVAGTGTKTITGVPGKSGTITITGLSANTPFGHTGTFTRKDSGMTTDAVATNTTYNYPYISAVETKELIIGNKQKLTLYNPLSRSVTIKMKKNSSTGTELYSGTTTSTSIEFTPTASTLYASIPSAKSSSAVYQCIYGSTNTHTTGNDFYYKIKGTEIPTFDSTYVTNVVDTLLVDSITGLNTKVIKGHNKITGSIKPMVANNSATGKRYVVTADASPGSQEISYATTNKTFTLENITSNAFTVTAYDSRELSKAVTVNLDLIDYTIPKINSFTITRENGIGEYGIITADGTCTYWKGWSQIKKYNTIQKVYTRYKVSSGNNWSNWIDITNGLNKNTEGSWSLSIKLDIIFNVTAKYDFQIYVTDLLESSSHGSNNLATANGFLWRDLKNKRLGINKKPERTLDVNGDIACNAIYVNGVKVLWEE